MERYIRSIIGITLALGTVIAAVPGGASAATTSIYVVDSSVTVRPMTTSTIPTQLKKQAAEITAARNEFESFQVVIEAGDNPLQNVTVKLANPGVGLSGPGGATIPSSNVTFYREAYYDVPTDYRSDRDGAAGRWPDPLIPERDPYYGQNRNAWPATAPANERLVAWVDVLAPQGQPAGQYRGSVIVEAGGQVLQTIPLRLHVLDFGLPSTSSLDNAFFINKTDSICRAHTNLANCGNEEKRWALNSLYARAALENRVSLANPAPLGQGDGPPTTQPKATYFDKYILPLIMGETPADPPATVATEGWSPIRLPGAKLTRQGIYAYRSWHCQENCAKAWETFAENKGYRGRLLLYACDEPGPEVADWQACDPYAMSYDTDLRKLATAHPADVPPNRLAKIDTLVVQIRYMTGKHTCCPGERFEGNQRDRTEFTEFLDPDNTAPGTPLNELWLYTACDAYACTDAPNSQDGAFNSELYDDWPSYAIDQKDTAARAMGWLTFLYDATGELYWEVVGSPDNANDPPFLRTAWEDQFHFGGQGDSTLFYPGIAKSGTGGPATAPIIGGNDDIPLESIRLKRIRDGREDYEYLKRLAVDLNKRNSALQVATALYGPRTLGDTTPVDAADLDAARDVAAYTTASPVELVSARCQLASRIAGVTACQWPDDTDIDPPQTTITSGPQGTVTTTTASFNFTSSEAGSSFQCSLDGGAYESCDSPFETQVGPGEHTFRVRATDIANNTDTTPAERTWTVNVEETADLSVAMTVLDQPSGPNFTYRTIVTNNGAIPGTDAKLTVALPPQVSRMSIASGSASCAPDGDQVECDLGSLGAGAQVAVEIVVRPGNAGPFTATATVATTPADANTDNDTDSLQVAPEFVCDMLGDNGPDNLSGTSSSDVLCGLGGNDVLRGGQGDDVILGGGGRDTVSYAGASEGMTINLRFQNPNYDGAWPTDLGGGDGVDVLQGIDRVVGGPKGDLVIGFLSTPNHIWGGKGPDVLHGYDAIDSLYGGPGRDELYGRGSRDYLRGGPGSDLCRNRNDRRWSCER